LRSDARRAKPHRLRDWCLAAASGSCDRNSENGTHDEAVPDHQSIPLLRSMILHEASSIDQPQVGLMVPSKITKTLLQMRNKKTTRLFDPSTQVNGDILNV
jgi:hypothetical protein